MILKKKDDCSMLQLQELKKGCIYHIVIQGLNGEITLKIVRADLEEIDIFCSYINTKNKIKHKNIKSKLTYQNQDLIQKKKLKNRC